MHLSPQLVDFPGFCWDLELLSFNAYVPWRCGVHDDMLRLAPNGRLSRLLRQEVVCFQKGSGPVGFTFSPQQSALPDEIRLRDVRNRARRRRLRIYPELSCPGPTVGRLQCQCGYLFSWTNA